MEQRTVDALEALANYTGNTGDVYLLLDSRKASCRAHIMSTLHGVKYTQRNSSVVCLVRDLAAAIGASSEHQSFLADEIRNAVKLLLSARNIPPHVLAKGKELADRYRIPMAVWHTTDPDAIWQFSTATDVLTTTPPRVNEGTTCKWVATVLPACWWD